MRFEKYIIVAFLFIIAIGVSFVLSPIEGFATIPILTFGFILLGKPRVLLFIYLGLVSVQPLLQLLSGTIIKRTDDLLAALLWGLFFSLLALRKINMQRIEAWWKFALSFVLYAGVSFLINRGTPRGAWQCVAIYMTFIPFFALMCTYLRPSDFKPVLIGTIIFFFFNVALNATWLLHINPLPNRAFIFLSTHGFGSGYIDASIGTFNSSAKVAYFCVFLFFLLFSVYRNIELVGKKWKKIIVFTMVVVFVQLYAAFANHSYIFFAISFIPFALLSGSGKKWQFVLLGVVAIIGVNIVISVSEPVALAFSKEHLTHRYEILHDSAKVQLFNDLLIKNAQDNPVEWLFGVGPGNGMGPVGKDNVTPFALEILLKYYQSVDSLSTQMTSITGNTTSLIFTLWSDFGPFGFLLYIAMYGVAFKKCVSVIRSVNSSLQKRVIAEALIGILVMLALTNIVRDLQYTVFFAFWPWLLVAFLYIPENADGEPVLKSPNNE